MTARHRLAGMALVALLVGAPVGARAADPYDEEPTPVASASAPSPSATGSAVGTITLVPFEDPTYDIASVAPEGWTLIGRGIRARGTLPEDPTLIALQTAPVGIDMLWKALLPQLGLTAIPPATDARQTDGLDWTIHDLGTTIGATRLSIAVALAEVDGSTSVILLQADPDEFEVLREAVFLPAIDAFELVAPEPTPDPATLGYHVEEVSFPGGSDGVELAGTLTLPETAGPFPVVVLMSGSGPQDRDEDTRPGASIKPFALIADALTRAGVGVLRYDDRGVDGSTGDYETATIGDLTEDARAALHYLATRDDVDDRRLGVLGHSEGGMYAATLGVDEPLVSFAILMAPPAVDGATLLVEQNAAVARSSGLPDVEVDATIDVYSRLCPAAIAGDDEGIETIIREATEAYYDRQTPNMRAALGDRQVFIDRQVAAQLPTLTSRRFGEICRSEPANDWSRVTIPILALFGGHDVQVLADSNAKALGEALEAAGNDDVTIVTVPDANHLFQSSETGALQEYPTLPDAFSPEVLPTIVDWLTEQLAITTEAPAPSSAP